MGVGCANSVWPANRMFRDVRPNLRTPQGSRKSRQGEDDLAETSQDFSLLSRHSYPPFSELPALNATAVSS
jgi:hypothetical protein